jgi:hypothetical protein
MKPFLTGLVATAGLLMAVGAAQANVFTNGSFETPVIPTSGIFVNYAVGSTALTGWTVTGPSGGGGVSTVSGTFSQNGVTFEAEDGSQWLDLTGDGSNTTEGVSQTVTTTSGHSYQLSFWIGNTTGGSIFGTTSTVSLFLNGSLTPSATDTNSNADATGLEWEEFTYDFVAGSSTTLDFVNEDPGNDNSNGLDNVVLLDQGPVTSAVPEPFTLSLFGAGLAGAAALRRRKKAKA